MRPLPLRISAIIIAAICTLSSHAEEVFAYADATSIDLSLGVSFNIANYHSEDYGAALFSGRIGNPTLALRVHHFFSRHWGAYIKAEWMQNSYLCSQKTVLNKLHERNDGFDYITTDKPKGRRGYALLAGASYRFDKLRWSLRPMLAVGFSSYNLNRTFTAFRKAEGTNRLQEMLYAIDQPEHRNLCGVVVSPALEATLHVTRRIDFFCNLAYEYNSTRVWQKLTITDLTSGRVLDSILGHEPIGNNISATFGVRYIITHR
ncbi:MAG: hypothetical protein PUD91_10145 [Bacteroidales bacterium]|nr:hypothetical protein [Bacteroidales bacterium]